MGVVPREIALLAGITHPHIVEVRVWDCACLEATVCTYMCQHVVIYVCRRLVHVCITLTLFHPHPLPPSPSSTLTLFHPHPLPPSLFHPPSPPSLHHPPSSTLLPPFLSILPTSPSSSLFNPPYITPLLPLPLSLSVAFYLLSAIALYLIHCLFYSFLGSTKFFPFLPLPPLSFPYLPSPPLTSPLLTLPLLSCPYLPSPPLASPLLPLPLLSSLTSPLLPLPPLSSPYLPSPPCLSSPPLLLILNLLPSPLPSVARSV